jgi:hypothetical protein
MTGVTTINPEIIPQGDGFDLMFFDWAFRNNGTRGTERPYVISTYEIWTRQTECLEIVEADDIPTHYEQNIRNGLAQFSRLTGGAVANPTITTKTHPVGTIIRKADSWLTANGTVSLQYHPADLWSNAMGDGWSAWFVWNGGEEQRSRPGHIAAGWRAAADLGVVTHELAHSLGFSHPTGTPTQSTIMIENSISAADELHGRILYKRPVGSLTPDRDPSGVTIN